MTPLEKIIEGATGDQTVTSLLRQVKVVASRASLPVLDEWVQHELDGYPDAAPLPGYRGPFATEVLGHFSGPFGSVIQNAPIPSVGFPTEYRNAPLFSVQFTQSISEIEALSTGDNELRSPWPANAIAMTNSLIMKGDVTLYEDMGLQQAWRVVTRTQVLAIVDAVMNRILDLALTLEAELPDAGEPGAGKVQTDTNQNIITNIYGPTANLAIASAAVNQNASTVVAGDIDSLITLLQSLGVQSEDVELLKTSLRDDTAEDPTSIGPRTSSWITRILLKAGDLGIGTSGSLIATAIARYLGLA